MITLGELKDKIYELDKLGDRVSNDSVSRRRELELLEQHLDIHHIKRYHSRRAAQDWLDSKNLRHDKLKKVLVGKSEKSKVKCMYLMMYAHFEGLIRYSLRDYLKILGGPDSVVRDFHPKLFGFYVRKYELSCNGSGEDFRILKNGVPVSTDIWPHDFDRRVLVGYKGLSTKNCSDIFDRFDLCQNNKNEEVKTALNALDVLVRVRNGIAHGDPKDNFQDLKMIDEAIVVQHIDSVYTLMSAFQNDLAEKCEDLKEVYSGYA